MPRRPASSDWHPRQPAAVTGIEGGRRPQAHLRRRVNVSDPVPPLAEPEPRRAPACAGGAVRLRAPGHAQGDPCGGSGFHPYLASVVPLRRVLPRPRTDLGAPMPSSPVPRSPGGRDTMDTLRSRAAVLGLCHLRQPRDGRFPRAGSAIPSSGPTSRGPWRPVPSRPARLSLRGPRARRPCASSQIDDRPLPGPHGTVRGFDETAQPGHCQ